jgi:hypothetical protein|tara:strand:- start:1867 stop:2148 length:282 start_codon:yes stop_codon:yes gene_type:complete
MADATKFTEDELKSLQELQGTYNQITMALGQLVITKLATEEREEGLKKALLDTKTKENDLAKGLTDKYGKGTLNIETGEFIPSPEETTEEVSK